MVVYRRKGEERFGVGRTCRGGGYSQQLGVTDGRRLESRHGSSYFTSTADGHPFRAASTQGTYKILYQSTGQSPALNQKYSSPPSPLHLESTSNSSAPRTMSAADRTVVLVTGANTGLGLATIQALYAAPEAYELILGSRSASNGENAVKEVEGGTKGNSATTVWPVQLDLADDKSIEAAFETVKDRVGHVDVLVNNAGGSASAASSMLASCRVALASLLALRG